MNLEISFEVRSLPVSRFDWVFVVLNSKLINWYAYRFIFGKAIRTMHFDSPVTSRIPFNLPEAQQPFIEKADLMLALNKDLNGKVAKFQKRLSDNLSVTKMTGKLSEFYNYDFKALVAELKKQKIVLSLKDQDEWEEYFNDYKADILGIKSQIEQTDKEIDAMVYELYGLTDEEIRIVEGS